jgi:hypothetical protein
VACARLQTAPGNPPTVVIRLERICDEVAKADGTARQETVLDLCIELAIPAWPVLGERGLGELLMKGDRGPVVRDVAGARGCAARLTDGRP